MSGSEGGVINAGVRWEGEEDGGKLARLHNGSVTSSDDESLSKPFKEESVSSSSPCDTTETNVGGQTTSSLSSADDESAVSSSSAPAPAQELWEDESRAGSLLALIDAVEEKEHFILGSIASPEDPPPPSPGSVVPEEVVEVVDAGSSRKRGRSSRKKEPSVEMKIERVGVQRPTAWVNPLPVVDLTVEAKQRSGGDKEQSQQLQPQQSQQLQQSQQRGESDSILHKLLQTNTQVEGTGEVIDRLKRLGTVVEVEPPAHLLEPVVDIVEDLGPDGTFAFRTDYFSALPLLQGQRCLTCDICSAVYQQGNLLRKHYLRLHVSRKYISERDLEQYSIAKEEDTEDGTRLVWRCHVCPQRFPGKNELRSHLTDHPPGAAGAVGAANPTERKTREFECGRCGAKFKWRKPYGRHKKNCKPPAPSLFHCLYCDETFNTANKKKNHVLSSHPYCRRWQPCSLCAAPPFPSHPALFSHLIDEHSDVYHACRTCKERFAAESELRAHDAEAHGGEPSVGPRPQPPQIHACPDCQRMFLVETSLRSHSCAPKRPQPPPDDPDTLFYSRVSTNIRDNLLHHLDGKLDSQELIEQDLGRSKTPGGAKILNFSASFGSGGSGSGGDESGGSASRGKTPWEKYSFPPSYDGRCGLTSYIRDTSYLDLSTQLIMRRNLQRLLPPTHDTSPDDVPSVLALERLGAQCAESFGQPQPQLEGGTSVEGGELSGEWTRDRTYICSVCRWESPCLWTMEDHKFEKHPHVHCPQHELVGDNRHLSKLIYTRLVEVDAPFGPPESVWRGLPEAKDSKCTKCGAEGFGNTGELHVHIVECAGVGIGSGGASGGRRRRKTRRLRRGLRRNIPQTPQPSHKSKPLRTKPGDSDTIQKMIANLPAKRSTRRAIGFDEIEIKTRSQATIQNVSNAPRQVRKQKPKPPAEKAEKTEEKKEEIKEERETEDEIETWAERGDVMSSLRMMRVGGKKPKGPPGMPTLEIEKDLAPAQSPDIPVLSPAPPIDNFICGISFVDGVIKYETVSSVTEELVRAGKKKQEPGGRKKRRIGGEKRKPGRPFGSVNRKVFPRSTMTTRRQRAASEISSPRRGRKKPEQPTAAETPTEETPEKKKPGRPSGRKTPNKSRKRKEKESESPPTGGKRAKISGAESIRETIEEVVRESNRLAEIPTEEPDVKTETTEEEPKPEETKEEPEPEPEPPVEAVTTVKTEIDDGSTTERVQEVANDEKIIKKPRSRKTSKICSKKRKKKSKRRRETDASSETQSEDSYRRSRTNAGRATRRGRMGKRKRKKCNRGEVIRVGRFEWEVSELEGAGTTGENEQRWEEPDGTTASLWQGQDPSLGTILDSVNKLLNEPETNCVPLGLPQYSLADLQRAMGASDAEMAVLQQLGEGSLQDAPTKDDDEWGETCIMDLDNQSPVAPVPCVVPVVAPLPPQPQPTGGDALLLEHSAKEVVCPSCSGHFLGFPALHLHITNAHSDLPNAAGSNQGKARRQAISVHKQDLLGFKRRRKEARLVCFQCRRILTSGAMESHLETDHSLPPGSIDSCPPADTEEGGERLKSKMTTALGDLLDRAVNNLIAAKRSGSSHQLSYGAVQLLTRLCAVRRKDTLHRRSRDDSDDANDKTSQWPYPCPVCQQRFNAASARNQHMLSAHTKPRNVDAEIFEYENDWREAPSPTSDERDQNGDAKRPVEPLCLDCGLGFDSLSELTSHRRDLHSARNDAPPNIPVLSEPLPFSVCFPPPLKQCSGAMRKKRESEPAKRAVRRGSLKKVRLTHIGEESVREKAEAALRELNLPRKNKEGSARWAQSMTFTRPAVRVSHSVAPCPTHSSDTYTFTDNP